MFDLAAMLDTNGAVWIANTRLALLKCTPKGVLAGLELSNDGADATNDLSVTAGRVLSDSGNFVLDGVTATHIKQVDVVFAEYATIGVTSGGRATADNLTGEKTFHVYIIGGSGKNDQMFFATSLTPTLPTGFTEKARIGSMVWTGSAWRGFVQNGDMFTYKAHVTSIQVTNPGTAAVTRLLDSPVGLKMEAILDVIVGSTGVSANCILSDLATTDESPTGLPPVTQWFMNNVANDFTAGEVRIMTDTAAQIRSRFSSSDANTTLEITTKGHIDTRGRA